MPKSRNRKKHKSKLAARNSKIKNNKNKLEKMKREFIMDLIKKEQEIGLFNNNPDIKPIDIFDDQKLDIEGPSI
jgi:hypothetical protein